MKDIAKQTNRMHRILDEAHEMAQKKCDEPAERMMFELVHAAIAIAGDHGRERSSVARSLGISKDTLNDRLCARKDRSFRFDDLARMIFDSSVLGDESHAWLMNELVRLAGRQFLMPMSDEPVGELLREGLEVADSVGFLSSTVLTVTDPMSAGGAMLTDTEKRQVQAAAGGVMIELGDVMTVGCIGCGEVVA